MKRIYLLMILLLSVAVNTYAAPRTCNLALIDRFDSCYNTGGKFVAITSGYKFLYDGGSATTPRPSTSVHRFEYRIKNLGPDTLTGTGNTDTVWVSTAFGALWGTRNFNLGRKAAVGDTIIVATDTLSLRPNSNITSSMTNASVNWCDSAFALNRTNPVTDPTASNDKICTTVSITWYVTGINTVSGVNDGFILYYPNPAHNNLNLKFDFGTGANASVLMRDITGKVVLQRELGKNVVGTQDYQLDISSLNPGLYTAELLYNDQRLVSKISVQ